MSAYERIERNGHLITQTLKPDKSYSVECSCGEFAVNTINPQEAIYLHKQTYHNEVFRFKID